MSAILIAATLAADPAHAAVTAAYTSAEDAARDLAAQMETGTLLFSRGDCLAIRLYTKSSYTHVAAVAVENGDIAIYDSARGLGVRRLSLPEYLEAQAPNRLHIVQPVTPFSEKRTDVFRAALEEQQGRPYAVRHFLTGRRGRGVHCSEYVTDALMACRLIHANQPARVSPASLLQGILQADLYATAGRVNLQKPPEPVPQGDNWCEQLWLETKACTSRCCTRLQRWCLCW